MSTTPIDDIDTKAFDKADPQRDEAQQREFHTLGPWAGRTLQMQPLGVQMAPYYVKCIGYVEKQSILVTAPMVDGKMVLIREGTPFNFRTFCGRNIITFGASILRVCHVPYPYVHLSYPVEVQAVTVRKSERIDINLIASVKASVEESGAGVGARIVDLSAHGAQINTFIPIGEAGDVVKLLFRLNVADNEVYLTLDAKLCRAGRKDSDGRTLYFYGVQFLHVSKQDHVYLQTFYKLKLLEKAGLLENAGG